MTRSPRFLRRAIFAALIGSASLAASAAAQRSSRHNAHTPAPTGWVGLSVIQSGRGDTGDGVTMGYPVIASVEPGSPAASAGLVAGDTIIAYNDVASNTDAGAVQQFLKSGSQLRVRIRRNGVRNLTLTVARRSARNVYREGVTISADGSAALPLVASLAGSPVAIAASVASGRSAPFAGSYFARMNAGLAGALNVKPAGVLVVDVGPGSAAMRSGLQSGDVITRADSIPVSSPLEIATAMRLASAQSVKLAVLRRGKPQTITVSW